MVIAINIGRWRERRMLLCGDVNVDTTENADLWLRIRGELLLAFELNSKRPTRCT